MLRTALATTSLPSASAPGESVSPAARIPTKAEPHSVTVTSPAMRAATSVPTATVGVADWSRTLIAASTGGRPLFVR